MFRRLKIWPGSGGMFKKVLIANRGEIAVRIIRALRELGVVSVAVFSEADREALHVRLADEAYPIGPPHPLESYLDVGRILEAARRARVQAIHPGYGFLAENPAFVQAVEKSGLVFIGPDAECLEIIRDKLKAREAARRAGVPVVPAVEHVTADTIPERAKELGYPLLLKSVAGGGGRGTRRVARAKEIVAKYEASVKEARWSFANPDVFLERLLKRARHIGVQIVADRYGTVTDLYEHEGSVQRRYQKLVEEAPSPAVDDKLRAQLVRSAVAVSKEVGLTGLGTVEFLLDGEKKFYFLGLNGRIQVEHPLTEMITGLDLVRMQVELAAGGKVPFEPGSVGRTQHAVQVRVTAEDPARGFIPSAGVIRDLELPGGSSVRVDSGIHIGQEVSLYYDPLLLKIVTGGRDRAEALSRLDRALAEFHMDGVVTGAQYIRRFLKYKPFLSGSYDVRVMEHFLSSVDGSKREIPPEVMAAAGALIAEDRIHRGLGITAPGPESAALERPGRDPWIFAGRWSGMRGGLIR
ncbi:MAG: ATP-grasp domain-containing protein [Planctomycetes bacterium]|nr:ATP-grasp domain-containing protein [Planctomycetota bacterium]